MSEAGTAPVLGEAAWTTLREAARQACARAYAPYSGFPVGAAALVDDGRVVTGCNVENASYGIGLCAECGVVSDLALGGGGRLLALVAVDATGGPLMPCGRCRQLLWEHADASMLVAATDGPVALADLLPRAFGRDDLDRVDRSRSSSPQSRPGPRDAPAPHRAGAALPPHAVDPEDLR